MYNCLDSALYRANPRCALFLVRPPYSPGAAEFAYSDLFKIIETGRVMTPFKSSVVHVEFTSEVCNLRILLYYFQAFKTFVDYDYCVMRFLNISWH